VNYWLLQAEKEQLEKDIEAHLTAKIAAGGSLQNVRSYIIDYLKLHQKTQFQVNCVVNAKTGQIQVAVI
jgi:hypothetical protein